MKRRLQELTEHCELMENFYLFTGAISAIMTEIN